MLQQVEGTAKDPECGKDTSAVRQLQDLLCGLLQVIIIRVGHQINDDLARQIISLIVLIFQTAGRVTESGLIAFQGVCVGLGDRIQLDEIGPFIKLALQTNELDVAKVACGIISDLSNEMGGKLNEYLADFAPCLHNILQSTDFKREIKLPAIHALGSLSLNSGDEFNVKYLPDTMNLLNGAAQMCTLSLEQFQDDPDSLDFLRELRDEILEQYTTIIIGVEDSGSGELK